MEKREKDSISLGCVVGLYCPTVDERIEYKLVKRRDTVEYKPRFGRGYDITQYYVAVTKFAEYADNELVEDRPLAKALIGKRLGDSFKINEYAYQIEKIIFPSDKILEIKEKAVVTPKSETGICPQYGIDWESGFVTECTKEELQLIHNFDEFMRREFPRFVGNSKLNRIAFCDPTIKLDGVQYSQFWFIKRGGVLTFRFKLDQNEKDEFSYNNNVLVADSVQFESIKTLVRLILKT